MSKCISILFVSEDADRVNDIIKQIESSDYKVDSIRVEDRTSFSKEIANRKWDIVIFSQNLKKIQFPEDILLIREISKESIFIIITERTDIKSTLEGICPKIVPMDSKERWEDRFWTHEFEDYEQMVSLHDSDYNILKASKCACERLGIKQFPVKCYHLFHNTENPPHFCPFKKWIENGKYEKKSESLVVFEKKLNSFIYLRCIPVCDNDLLLGCLHICSELGKTKLSEIISNHLTLNNLEPQSNEGGRVDTILRHFSRIHPQVTPEPLKVTKPDEFNQFVQIFAQTLDLALDQQVYKVEHPLSEKIKHTAELLGRLNATPRDVVEIYRAGIKEKVKDEKDIKSQAYKEEGLYILIELMGHLADYYRKYSKYSLGLTIPGGIKIIKE